MLQFIADSDHRDAYGGDADLRFIPNSDLTRNAINTDDAIEGVEFKFQVQHPPLVDADILSVESGHSDMPVMSQKMTKAIEDLGGKLLKYPALIEPPPPQKYYVVQLPVIDAIDWENSEYNTEDLHVFRDGEKLIAHIRKYAFSKPIDELPPVFRLRGNPYPMLMRSDVRDVFRQQGVRGIAFMNAGSFSKTNQFRTDIPV